MTTKTNNKNTKVKTKTKDTTMTNTTERPDLNGMLVTTGQIASMLNVTQPMITNYKQKDSFPQPAFINGRVVLYWKDDVDAWVSSKLKARKDRAAKLEARAQEMLEKAKRMRSKK